MRATGIDQGAPGTECAQFALAAARKRKQIARNAARRAKTSVTFPWNRNKCNQYRSLVRPRTNRLRVCFLTFDINTRLIPYFSLLFFIGGWQQLRKSVAHAIERAIGGGTTPGVKGKRPLILLIEALIKAGSALTI